jgi:hypothetical protein
MADRVERDPAGALCSSLIRNEAPSNAVEGEIISKVIAAAPTEQRADSIAVITPHRAQRTLRRSACRRADRMGVASG